MKRLVVLLLCFTLVSCIGTRKTEQSTTVDEVYVQKKDTQSVKVSSVIDTTVTDEGRVTVTEIEFYEPPPVPGNVSGYDTIVSEGNVDVVTLVDVVSLKNAAVKSIKQTTYQKNYEQKGQSEVSNESNVSNEQVLHTNSKQSVQSNAAPVKFNNTWKYIFYILILVGIVMLYLNRNKVLSWVKKMVARVLKMFL